METCQRKVNSHSVSRSVYLMSLFDWRLVKEEKNENAPSILYFERDTDTPYYQEMVEIEKETSPRLMPFWVLIIFVGIAFALITTALILSLLKIPGFDALKCFFIFYEISQKFFTIRLVWGYSINTFISFKIFLNIGNNWFPVFF